MAEQEKTIATKEPKPAVKKSTAGTAKKTTAKKSEETTKKPRKTTASASSDNEVVESAKVEPVAENKAENVAEVASVNAVAQTNESVKAEEKPVEKGIEQAEVQTASVRKKTKGEKWSLGICIAVCALMLPILIFNIVLIFESAIHPNNVPSFFGVKPMIVMSDSMYPEIKFGDMIVSKSVKNENDLKVGDVITFREKTGSVVTHKISRIETDGEGVKRFVTYGTNNYARNSDGTAKLVDGKVIYTEDAEWIPFSQVEGKYTGTRIAGLGSVILWMQTTWGLIICIGVPLLLFIIYELVRSNAELKAQKSTATDATSELEELRKKLAELEGDKK